MIHLIKCIYCTQNITQKQQNLVVSVFTAVFLISAELSTMAKRLRQLAVVFDMPHLLLK